MLGAGEAAVLDRVAEGVFDYLVRASWAEEFFHDPRHHLAVAIDCGKVVGMASGVHYLHPDKAPQLFVNEVGVSPDYRQRGLGKRLVRALLEQGKALGCSEAWVLTDFDNLAARRLYAAEGGRESPAPQVMVTFPFEQSSAEA